MATKCEGCIFKDIDGGKYPCNDCSEIMDMRSMKYVKNHFEQINEDKNNESKERLKKKLDEIAASLNREVLYEEYKIMEDRNMKLTAFLNCGNDIAIYQIVDTREELVQNVVSVEKELLRRVGEMW